MTPLLGALVLGEMPSLPLTPLPPALPWRLGVMLSLSHLPQVGVPSNQWDMFQGSQLLFLLPLCSGHLCTIACGNLAILPSHSPLSHCSQSQAKPQRLCCILPHLTKTPVTGGPSSFLVAPGNLPPESILPFFLHRSLVLEFSHCTMSLALGGSATYRDAPREQTFHTSIS